jgi:hypothetical protein
MIHERPGNKYSLNMRVSPTPMAAPDQAIGVLAMRAGLLVLGKFDQSVR